MRNWFLRAGMIFLVPALFLPSAFGIGRSGNGTVGSQVLGFTVKVPENFENLQTLKDEKLRLLSFLLEPRPGGGFLQPFLELSSAEQSLPALAKLSRADLPEAMGKLGWEKTTSPNPCVEAFRQNTDSSAVLALFWGGGKGMVAVGPQSPNVNHALDGLLATFQLEKGACAW